MPRCIIQMYKVPSHVWLVTAHSNHHVRVKISMRSLKKKKLQTNQPSFYSGYIKVNNIGLKGYSSEGRWIIFLEVSGFLELLW